MKVQKTEKGYLYIEFKDVNGQNCSLQQSSAIDHSERGFYKPGSSFVWLGMDDNRMHLDRDMVKKIICKLIKWVITRKF